MSSGGGAELLKRPLFLLKRRLWGQVLRSVAIFASEEVGENEGEDFSLERPAHRDRLLGFEFVSGRCKSPTLLPAACPGRSHVSARSCGSTVAVVAE